jgi:hypothetical protein
MPTGKETDLENEITHLLNHAAKSQPVSSPSPAGFAAHGIGPKIYAIAHDEQLAGDNEPYRLWLMRFELERFWNSAQEEALAQRRDRPGIKGWIARRFDI